MRPGFGSPRFDLKGTPLCRQLLFLYRVFPHLVPGANVIITVLWNTLLAVVAQGRDTRKMKLFLQLDGASDNINLTMYAFCSWLVQQGYFHSVSILSFASYFFYEAKLLLLLLLSLLLLLLLLLHTRLLLPLLLLLLCRCLTSAALLPTLMISNVAE